MQVIKIFIFCLFDWTLWSGPRLPLGSLKTLNFNFLFTAVTLDSDFNNSFIALWSGLCTLGGTQRTWQCPITTTTGSPSVAICYLSLQLVFAICLCYLSLQPVFAICFYNLLFVCKCFPYRSAHPELQFPDFLKLFMANLLVQVKFSCMKTQSFISNTFLLFRVPTWPT